MSRGSIGSRREDRERILGLLYEAETKEQSLEELIDALPTTPSAFIHDICLGIDEHRAEIDEQIGAHAEHWTVDRMPALDRAILRMSTYELLYTPETPTGVVISEAVELASQYSTERSSRFVNGLLAGMAPAVRARETPS